MAKYVDSCRTLEILYQDSGLLPKPMESWNTFIPQKGDVVYVDETRSEYEFDGSNWIRIETPSWEEKLVTKDLEVTSTTMSLRETRKSKNNQKIIEE